MQEAITQKNEIDAGRLLKTIRDGRTYLGASCPWYEYLLLFAGQLKAYFVTSLSKQILKKKLPFPFTFFALFRK